MALLNAFLTSWMNPRRNVLGDLSRTFLRNLIWLFWNQCQNLRNNSRTYSKRELRRASTRFYWKNKKTLWERPLKNHRIKTWRNDKSNIKKNAEVIFWGIFSEKYFVISSAFSSGTFSKNIFGITPESSLEESFQDWLRSSFWDFYCIFF